MDENDRDMYSSGSDEDLPFYSSRRRRVADSSDSDDGEEYDELDSDLDTPAGLGSTNGVDDQSDIPTPRVAGEWRVLARSILIAT